VLALEASGSDVPSARAAADTAAAALPGGRAYPLREPQRPLGKAERASSDGYDVGPREMYTLARPGAEDVALSGYVAVAGDPREAERAAGMPLDTASRRALAAGRILVFGDGQVRRDGRVAIDATDDGAGQALLPAFAVARPTAYTSLPAAVMPISVARAHGWHIGVARMLVEYAATATADQRDAAIDAAEQKGVTAYAESGPSSPNEGCCWPWRRSRRS
jgi:hypothetical protein